MPVLMTGGAGTSGSGDCTATKAKVLAGYTAITSDSDDEVANGTLSFVGNAAVTDVYPNKTFYNNDPLTRRTGSLAPSSITNFAATNYSTGVILLTWKKPSSRWSGIRIGYRSDGSYPTSVNDSNAVFVEVSGDNRSFNIAAGYTYKFRAWNYLTTSAGRIYGSYSNVSIYAPNNAGSTTLYGSGTWEVPVGVRSITVFMVGGGGGGGGGNYRGGGGGGYTKTASFSVTPGQKIAYTVGAGGSAGGNGVAGGAGGNTTFGNQTANGGGGSKWEQGATSAGSGWRSGGDGGSGGGARSMSTEGSSLQSSGGAGGTNGGLGDSNTYNTSGNKYLGGYGQGTTTGEYGVATATKYGGGGGGGGHTASHGGGSGGATGGGAGSSSSSSNGSNGSANTGGGGGGGFGTQTSGGKGGSGIIKIKWS